MEPTESASQNYGQIFEARNWRLVRASFLIASPAIEPRVRKHERVRLGEADCCWDVELEDGQPLDVRLPAEERSKLELSDDQLHDLLPTALVRHLGVRDTPHTSDQPVRLYADHFRG